jgi:hypothetical protein
MSNPNTNLYVVTLEQLSSRTAIWQQYTPLHPKGTLILLNLSNISQKKSGFLLPLNATWQLHFFGRHTDFQRLVQQLGINLTYAEPYRHNQLQQVDVAIQELKQKWRNKMGSRNVPQQIWCFGLEHQARLMHFIPRGHNKRSGYEMITGKTPAISEYLDFNFYDLVWYWRQPSPSLSEHDRELARWMGVAHRVGLDMCYWLMPVSGVPVVNSSVQHVTAENLQNPEIM